MKKVLIGLGVLVGLVVLAVFLIPMFIPKEALEARIEQAASEAMGRQVTIDGPPDISILPTAVNVRGLQVANAEGFDAPYLLRVDEADIGVKLLPLLSKRIEITRFDLKQPDINLQARPEGDANWVLTPPESEDPDAPLPDVRLGTVTITDGAIRYDGGTGTTYAMTDADVTIQAPSLDDTLEASGTMLLEGRETRFDATVRTPRTLAEAGVAELTMTAAVGENEISAAGRLGEAMSFGGRLDVNARDLRNLMALSGAAPPEGPGFERLALTGEVSGNAERVTFAEGTTVSFDDIEGTGNVTIDLSGERPNVVGSLRTGLLDLRPYVPSEPAPERDKDAPFPPWSDAPIDLSALQMADADISVSAAGILLPTVTVGESAARLLLKDGRMDMQLERMALYGGNGSGGLIVDAGRATPVIEAAFSMAGIGVQGLMSDVMDLDRLTGTGEVRLDLTTAGDSQADFVNNLSGDVAAELDNGAVRGVNIGKVARSTLSLVEGLRTSGLNVASLAGSLRTAADEARGPDAETDFSEMLIDLSIDSGVVTTDAVRVTGPYYRVEGDGTVNLPDQTVRMTLQSEVSSADGQPLRELPAPILVSGTFSDPKFGVDAAPLAEAFAGDQLRNALGRAGIQTQEGQTLEDTVREGARQGVGRLLGGTREAAEPDAAEAEEASPPPSARDQAIERGLGAIFGGRTTPAEEQPETEEQESADEEPR